MGDHFEDDELAAIRKQYEAGETIKNLAKAFKRGQSTLYRIAKEQGWVRRCRGYLPALADEDKKTKRVEKAKSGEQLPVELTPQVAMSALDKRREKVTKTQLAVAEKIMAEVDRIFALPDLGTEGKAPRTRALNDLTQALERIQKVERIALAMDQPGQSGTQVVIIVPGKDDEEAWAAKAIELRQERDGTYAADDGQSEGHAAK